MKRVFPLLFICLLALTLCACSKALDIPEAMGGPYNEEEVLADDAGLGLDEEEIEQQEEELEDELDIETTASFVENMQPGEHHSVQTDSVSITITCISAEEADNYSRWDNSNDDSAWQNDYEIKTGEDYIEYLLSNGNTIIDMRLYDYDYKYKREGYQTYGDTNIYLLTKEGEKLLLLEGDPLVRDSMEVPHIFQILDDYSFLYIVASYEDIEYSGLYDIQNYEDHPFEDTGYPELLVENTLFTVDSYGELLFGLTKTDLTTFETNDLLTDIIASSNTFDGIYDISPDGRYFALYHQDSWNDDIFEYDENYVRICSLESDSLLYSLPIQGIYGIRHLYFCSETQIIVHLGSNIEDDSKIFLIEIEANK